MSTFATNSLMGLNAMGLGGARGGSMSLAPWLMGGGLGLSAAGGLLGAQSTNRAARQARDWYASRTGEGMERSGMFFLGSDAMDDMVSASRGDNAAQRRLTDRTGGPVYDQMRGVARGVADAAGQNAAAYDADTAGLRDLSQGNLARLMQMLRADAGDVVGQIDQVGPAVHGMYDRFEKSYLDDYDRRTGAIMRDVEGYGRGREDVIRRDADVAEREAQGEAAAGLAASGFGGSTTAAMTRAGITRSRDEGVQRRLQELGDEQIDRRTGLATNFAMNRSGFGERSFNSRAGNLMALNAARIGALESAAARRGSAAAGLTGQVIDNEYRRGAGAAALREGNLDRVAQYELMPAQSLMALTQSGVWNPWLNANSSGYYPGASPGASVGVTAGNALSGLGSLYLMKDFFNS